MPATRLELGVLAGSGGGGGGGGVYSESYTRGGAIPNEVGPARCRATPALNQSADETHTPASQCLPAMPLPRREEEEEEEEFIQNRTRAGAR